MLSPQISHSYDNTDNIVLNNSSRISTGKSSLREVPINEYKALVAFPTSSNAPFLNLVIIIQDTEILVIVNHINILTSQIKIKITSLHLTSAEYYYFSLPHLTFNYHSEQYLCKDVSVWVMLNSLSHNNTIIGIH